MCVIVMVELRVLENNFHGVNILVTTTTTKNFKNLGKIQKHIIFNSLNLVLYARTEKIFIYLFCSIFDRIKRELLRNKVSGCEIQGAHS
jgi:hypothetical protein